MELKLTQIGHVETDFKEKFGIPRQSGLSDSIGKLIIESPFNDANAFSGLEDFSHIWLIWGFSDNPSFGSDSQKWSPTVRPPKLGGNVRKGVFATRSPNRPNSLGLSLVELISIEIEDGSPVLYVKGVDMLDGTPIYDIKPYLPYCESRISARGGFTDNISLNELDVQFLDECKLELLNKEEIETLRQILSQDPRPQYHDDCERIYGMKYSSFDIHFRVEGNVLTVIEIERIKA